MAIGIKQDLYYNRAGFFEESNLISVYNPNVILFYSNSTSTDTEPLATLEIVSAVGTFEFECVFLGKDTSNRYQYKIDLSNILKSLLEDFSLLNEQPDVLVQQIITYDNEDSHTSLITLNFTVDFDDIIDDTYSCQYMLCRSVNNWGDEGGSNLYSIYAIATRPTYYIWDGMLSEIGVFLRNPAATTTLSFNRTMTDITGSSLSAGMHRVNLLPNINDKVEKLINGEFDLFYEPGIGETYPDAPTSWLFFGWNGETNYFEDYGGQIAIIAQSTMRLYQNVIESGRDYEVSINVIEVSNGSLLLKTTNGELLRTITNSGVQTFRFHAIGTGSVTIETVGVTEAYLYSVSLKESYANKDKQIVEMSVNDDSETRYADIVIRPGCADGLNLRWLSRDYGIRMWQFNEYYEEESNSKELGAVISMIDDMKDHTKLEQVTAYESYTTINAIFKNADIEEQKLLTTIFSSPFVQLLINDVWVGVRPLGSHKIDTKKKTKNFNISFQLPKSFNQEL